MAKSKKYPRRNLTDENTNRSAPSPSDLDYTVTPPPHGSQLDPIKQYNSAPIASKSSKLRQDSIITGAHQAKPRLEREDESTETSRATSPTGLNSGAYIDHRTHNDLAHIHSSPARYRRRATQKYTPINKQDQDTSRRFTENPNSSLPLTNKNLQNLLNNSRVSTSPTTGITGITGITGATGVKGTSPISPSAVTIDMDQYTHEQRQLARVRSWNNPFNSSNIDEAVEGGEGASFHSDQYDDRYSVNSLEFGESNPSSEHSSDSTSLDDVCFPDYYHDGSNTDAIKTSQWPDLRVLEEFVREELEEAEAHTQHSISEDMFQTVNFQGNNIIHNDRPQTMSSSPKYTESTPLMENYQVNEVESLGSMENTVRIRPTPIQPWEMTKEKVPTILNKSSSRNFKYNQRTGKLNGELCRFTYFREDLNKTIHSPSISGLVLSSTLEEEERLKNERSLANDDDDNDDDDESPPAPLHDKTIYEKLEDLFQPTHYTERVSTRTSSVHESVNHVSTMLTASGISSTNLVMQAKSVKGTTNVEAETPRPGTAYGSMNDIPSQTLETEIRPEPFWLDVLDPTEEEMKVLSKTFGIHPLTTEDIFLGEAREKVELFKSYYFICFTSFDVVYERRKQRAKENEKKMNKLQEMLDNSSCIDDDGISVSDRKGKIWKYFTSMFGGNVKDRRRTQSFVEKAPSTSVKSRGKKIREGELSPLNMYIIVFKDAVITFHFSATPHPINVRRRARMLKEFLTVSSDWICYALIDDITDSFAPMIDTIENEVNSIEDAILKMHSGDTDTDTDDSDSDADEESSHHSRHHHPLQRTPTAFKKKPATENVFVWRKRSKSTVDHKHLSGSQFKVGSISSSSSKTSSSKSTESKILGWKRKGDMLRRIGECRKRVMSVLRLLGTKADVIKGFSKRFNENSYQGKQEIGMYLGDIQDHIVTMVQALNHYEKLLARFHSNYLAQINIDMTKVNNDTNDVLGKITILGTIVLPINVVTGLWGMNCIVPGQDYEGLTWFWGIVCCMILFSICAYNYAKRVFGL